MKLEIAKEIRIMKCLRNILGIRINHFGKHLFQNNQVNNDQIVNQFNDALINFRNVRKEISENENPEKRTKLAEKIIQNQNSKYQDLSKCFKD